MLRRARDEYVHHLRSAPQPTPRGDTDPGFEPTITKVAPADDDHVEPLPRDDDEDAQAQRDSGIESPDPSDSVFKY